MILRWSPFKIVSVSAVLYPRWPPLLKIEISSNGQNCSILSQKVPKFELHKHNDELFSSQIWFKPNCTWMFIGRSSTISRFFVPIWISKWTLWEKCFKMLLLWNHFDSWNQTAQEWSLEGPLQISVFYADWKSKMAATAGHRLTLDPMGKYSNAFFSETTNMIKAKLYMNVH